MKKYLFFVFVISVWTNTHAAVNLHNAIGDNMVIQQNADVNFWGWDTPGKEIRVSTSWTWGDKTCKADENGRWIITIKAPKASFIPLSITFDDGEKTTISNILSGDVWLAGGQSNMEMPIKGFDDCPIEGYNQAIADAVNTRAVRFCKVPSERTITPQEECNCRWLECGPENVGEASATAYFFARMVSKVMNIPIGILEVNKGGSRVESWLNEKNLRDLTNEPLTEETIKNSYPFDYIWPLMWYNGTMHPVLNYTIKGFIFYQGCSNVDRNTSKYAFLLTKMVEQWRQEFRAPNAPFYFVEIAPYNYGKLEGISGALLREQQHKATKMIPNSAIIGTNDNVYPWETTQIHPTQKQKVGERLATLALEETYGITSFMGHSPELKEMKVKDGKVYLTFNNSYNAMSPLRDIKGFEIAGDDKVFHPVSNAEMHYGTMIMSCPEVKKPVAVRYCFKNFELGNVTNRGNNPLLPFRTDDW